MNYSIAIETFKRMYKAKELEISKIKQMLNKKIITLDEYNYILDKKEG